MTVADVITTTKSGLGWFMVFNATFNNISVILWWSSFIGGGNQSIKCIKIKSLTCRKSLTNFITYVASSAPRYDQDPNSQLKW